MTPRIDHPRYACGEVLGEGAQGLVMRVIDREQPSLSLVAKMTWAGEPAHGAATAAHLEGEFALLARLRVPGLVRVHDFARDPRGVPFLVEDFVDGQDPAAFIGKRAPRFLALAADLAETLSGLHEAGFVHGDVKPANVRVPDSGRAMLLDLGAAGMLRARRANDEASPPALVFTEAFAAPELRAGARPSIATDIYALGMTLWTCALDGTLPRSPRSALRDRAPWVTPSVAALVEAMAAEHPADRPTSARAIIEALGRSMPRSSWEAGARGSHAREKDVTRLLALDRGAPGTRARRVVYLTGPSGAGKSHVAREVSTRALLAGRSCRTVRFPEADAALVPRLVAYLRGDEGAAPWSEASSHASDSMLLVLDDLEAAPAEVIEALDVFRCTMHVCALPVVVIATARTAPSGAETVLLGALDVERFAVLCRELGVPPAAAAPLHRETGGLPGWVVASLGRVPLSAEAVLARLRSLEPTAQEALALVATFGGTVPAAMAFAEPARPTGFAALFVAGLLTRDGEAVRLASPQLARDVADALSSFTISDRVCELALGWPELPAASLLAAGSAPSPPARRTEVLSRAAEQARREGARSIEIEALLALAASAAERTAARLSRLERLTRDAGTSRAHPQVLAWLEEAAAHDPAMRPLAARRRAEERARAGDHDAARASADSALEAAHARRDVAEEAYALATKGAIRLFAADWAGADNAFNGARAKLAAHLAIEPERVDREEIARLEHNVGVVALYRGRVPAAIEAFERSVTIKRTLGDRAGIRACLLNLGLALTRAGRHEEAERALVEATSLAEALGQAAGRAWCLAARAELAVRCGRARDAEELVAEAAALGDAVPGAVRADLVLLRSEIALLEGDGRAATDALASLGSLEGDVRASDALIDARAYVLEARALLARLPADRHGAARAAIASLRRARAAGLADAEAEGLAALRAARKMRYDMAMTSREAITPGGTSPDASPRDAAKPDDDGLWQVIATLAREADSAVALAELAAHVLAEARAERAIIAALDDGGRVIEAWGVDMDGLPIAQADERVDVASVEAARRRGAPAYQSDVVTRAGRGARLVVAGPRAAVVVEHRFSRGAFDHVAERAAMRWGTMAELAVRLIRHGERGAAVAPPVPRMASSSDSAPRATMAAPSVFSTAMPRRDAQRDFPEILGASPALRRALAQLDSAVDTDLPVVIQGETGTGKELFARALHDHGSRSTRAFVAVNCAAIADALFEAELFGHARGAFTGADRARPGLLARAEGGTLLLDEIGELPLARQATLLRALESRRYRAVGNDDERAFDVRIVAATNRDLDAAASEGAFRRDLLYRLRVLEINVPALRDRTGDVDLLLRHFLAKAASRATVSPAALAALTTYAFPGNIRELLHISQRLAAARVDRVDVAHLPRAVRLGIPPPPRGLVTHEARAPEGRAGLVTHEARAPEGRVTHTTRAPEGRSGRAGERAEVEAALGRTAGNISRAAVLLGLSRHGLKKKMLRLGLRVKAGAE